jgi:hypothetical protein
MEDLMCGFVTNGVVWARPLGFLLLADGSL